MEKGKSENTLKFVTFGLFFAGAFRIVSWRTMEFYAIIVAAIATVAYGVLVKMFANTQNAKTKKMLEFVFAGLWGLSVYLLSVMWGSLIISAVANLIILLGTIQMTRKEEASRKFREKKAKNPKEATDEVGQVEQVKA